MAMAAVKYKDRLKDLQKREHVPEDLMKRITEAQNESTFDVDLNPPNFIQFPPIFNIERKNEKPEEGSKSQLAKPGQQPPAVPNDQSAVNASDNPASNKLALIINFKVPVKEYQLTLTMKNRTLTDIRIYDIVITIFPKVIKASLEMATPARIPIEQNIPIINTMDKDCPIKITWVDIKNGSAFSYPNVFSAKKKGTSLFPVKFSPAWTAVSEARLTLNNPLTNDTFEYELKGLGEEPLAEDHLLIESRVREENILSIAVKNPSERVMMFKVLNELNHSKGDASFKVKPMGEFKYKLKVCPILGGEYTGSIVFTNDEGHYQWYTIGVKAESSKCERIIE
jgi:hypothetical protein